MHPLRKRIPTLNVLFAVEAVGRHLSFTAAAQELGVSQPAVSKAIRAVESGLGYEIFAREHKRLSMTPKGHVFVRETSALLQQFSNVVAELAPSPDANIVHASFSSSFVTFWMLPRIHRLKSQIPGVVLHLHESDSDMVDLKAMGQDFSARLGVGNWDDVESWFLISERVGAVASPAYLAQRPHLSAPDSLSEADLIHVNEPERIRLSWKKWLEYFDCKAAPSASGLVVSDYHSAVDAAVLGQGVVLGWEHLIADKVAEGLLTWVGDHRIETGKGIYLVAPLDGVQSEPVNQFRRWVVEEFNKACKSRLREGPETKARSSID